MQTTELNFETLPIKIDYVGETIRDDGWHCDHWRITLSDKNNYWTTDYFTGLGHRKVNKWKESKPVKPDMIGVLYSLFMDAQSTDQNFIDWCADFGYSDDSMKAFNIYKKCCEIALALRKYFSPETRAQIQAAIKDY